MSTLLLVLASNALMASLLALLAVVIGRICRHPALTHSLWVLVLLKLVTPPLFLIPISWPAANEAASIPQEKEKVAEIVPVDPGPPDHEQEMPPNFNGDGGGERPGAVPEPQPPRINDWPLENADPARAALETPGHKLPLPGAVPERTVQASWKTFWAPVLLAVWLGGAALWFGLAGHRLCLFHRLLGYARAAPPYLERQARLLAQQMGLSACPQVCVVPGSISPLLWTIFGPGRLIIPADLLDRLDRDQQATLLAHELAHLRRHDPWVRCLEFLVTGLYWWHPVVWWARHEIREAEEQCCDAWVIRVLPGGTRAYATALIETVDFLSEAQPALPPVASGIGYFHIMRRRLTMIMRGDTPQSLTGAGFLAVVTMGVVLLPLFPTLGRSDEPRETPRDRKDDVRRDDRRDDRGRGEDEVAKARAMVKQLADEMQQLHQRLQKAKERLDQLEHSRAKGRGRENEERPARERGPERLEKPRRPQELDPRRERGNEPRFRPPDGRREGGPQRDDGRRDRRPDGRRDGGPPRADDRLTELERKVNLLLREVQSLRQELRGGRGGDRQPRPREGRIGRPVPRAKEPDKNPPENHRREGSR